MLSSIINYAIAGFLLFCLLISDQDENRRSPMLFRMLRINQGKTKSNSRGEEEHAENQ